MIKIIATISDYGAAAHVGGDVIKTSHVINIPTNNIPLKLKEYLENKQLRALSTLSFSLLDEE